MDVKGLAAIVTGGASGLGEATARALAKAGAKVAVLDLNADAAKRVADDIGGLGLRCDVTSAGEAEAALAEARKAHGPARVAVNCAGVGTPGRILGKDGPQPLENFTKVVNINLIGTFNILRLAAHDMSQQEALPTGERGIVIFTASVAAFDGQFGQAAYAGSKAGVVGMMLPAARELSKFGIRVLTIAPGIFGTPMLFALPKEIQDALGASVPFPSRLGRPEEYAKLVMHMCDNEMLNGEVVRLDGAIRLPPK